MEYFTSINIQFLWISKIAKSQKIEKIDIQLYMKLQE